ncbi:HTH myb-type domain-containing protein [Psidium guajava]|nr:HTH myb-type domain-containing protein [Psidium guajava]
MASRDDHRPAIVSTLNNKKWKNTDGEQKQEDNCGGCSRGRKATAQLRRWKKKEEDWRDGRLQGRHHRGTRLIPDFYFRMEAPS